METNNPNMHTLQFNMPMIGAGSDAFWRGGYVYPSDNSKPVLDTATVGRIEFGPSVKDYTKGTAIKFDQDKIDWSILPIGASEEIIKVFKFGEAKYARGNFLEGDGLEYSRVINSLLRHVHAFMRGEDLDPETGISHIAHAGCNIYMLLTYELNKQKFNNDDRAEKIII